jgi:hypothetical protein
MGYIWEEAEHDSVIHLLKTHFEDQNKDHFVFTNPSYDDSAHRVALGRSWVYPDLIVRDSKSRVMLTAEVTVPSGLGEFLPKSVAKWRLFSMISKKFFLVVPSQLLGRAQSAIQDNTIPVMQILHYDVDLGENLLTVAIPEGHLALHGTIKSFREHTIYCDLALRAKARTRSEKLATMATG